MLNYIQKSHNPVKNYTFVKQLVTSLFHYTVRFTVVCYTIIIYHTNIICCIKFVKNLPIKPNTIAKIAAENRLDTIL